MPVDAAAVHDQVVRAARALGVGEVEAILAASSQALTRFANNAIHQNVAELSSHLSVRARIEGRTARASTNRLDPASIRDVVEQAIALTRLTEPDEESLPLAEPAEYRGVRPLVGTDRADYAARAGARCGGSHRGRGDPPARPPRNLL